MALPASGTISLALVLAELQKTNAGRSLPISLGDTDVRTLAGVPSGAISLTSLYGKSNGSALSAAITNGSATYSSISSGGTAICNPGVTASGGTPGYTYLWSFTSNPNSCTLGSSTSTSCSVSKAFSQNAQGGASAVLQCIITDSASGTITKTGITATLSWENGS